jgi:hypothetical protein
MAKDKILEKAQHNVGDLHPNGLWRWTDLGNGKFDWKSKDGKYWKGKNAPAAPAAPTAAQTDTKPAADAAPAAASATQQPAAPVKKPYDAPKPKVVYRNTPKNLYGYAYEVPEEWEAKNRQGQKITQKREDYRKLFSDKKQWDDQKIIDIINNPNLKNPNVQQLAWEEAIGRGIPEDKIKLTFTLKGKWENEADKWKKMHPEKNEIDDLFGSSYNSAIGNFDVEKYKQLFPKGDTGWMNKNDNRVKKTFHNFETLTDRQQFDAVLDLMKREDPYYFNTEDQLAALRIQLDGFIEQPQGKGSAMFVSTGGAGAGKTTALLDLLKSDAKHVYDPDKDESPTADDVDAVILESDIDDEKDFFETLRKYNGKIIIFDDKDKALVSNATKLKSALKNIADSNPKMRLIPGKDGKPERFTGKLIFITNKTFDDLITDEDKKAIFSRADKNDIQFTLNENLEVLENRYEKMGGRYEELTPQQEKELRESVYNLIINNVEKIDPFKFTVRKFTELMNLAVRTVKGKKKSVMNADFDAMFGGSRNSKALDWKKMALRELNKGENDIFEKANSAEVIKNLSKDDLKRYKTRYKKNPKEFEKMFGKKLVDALLDNDDDDEVVKAIIDDFGEMSVEDAEKLLLF